MFVIQGKGWGGQGEAEQEQQPWLGWQGSLRGMTLLMCPAQLGWEREGSRMDGCGWALLPPSACLLKIPVLCSALGARLPFQHQHNDSSYITQQPIQQAHNSKELVLYEHTFFALSPPSSPIFFAFCWFWSTSMELSEAFVPFPLSQQDKGPQSRQLQKTREVSPVT